MKRYFIIYSILLQHAVEMECGFDKTFNKLKLANSIGNSGKPLFLTPLIENKQFLQARSLSRVYFNEFRGVKSYSGFITVDKNFDSNLFFWFFPAERDISVVPLLLWLQGGPGTSSMYGLFAENGPFEIRNNKATLRRTRWTKSHSVLYIDNPVGSGFSFTRSGYAQNQTKVGEDLYQALKQFFLLFPELQKNEFFVTGESYAGKYIPAVSHTIHKYNQKGEFKINLKGLAIGNGLCDPEHQLNYGEYLYQLGLIDGQQLLKMTEMESRVIQFIRNKDYLKAFHLYDELLNGDLINYPTLFHNFTGFSYYFNYLKASDNDIFSFLEKYFSRTKVRAAIHVGNSQYGDENVEKYLTADFMQSVSPWITNLLKDYRILFYNGQLDIIVAYPLTVNFLNHLNFESAKEYKSAKRHLWYVGNELAGYIKTAGNLTEVLVRNAGHFVPTDQPEWALRLIEKFTKNDL